ncbi:uncharacterized protein LOC134413155 [Elgaria multicarinata webbii]|uniref:uncharacterized protein LOC134413155 n=1 Tax=Elgaria multicarinata webbii TaxID=159646 RepID=UPI002FCD20A5
MLPDEDRDDLCAAIAMLILLLSEYQRLRAQVAARRQQLREQLGRWLLRRSKLRAALCRTRLAMLAAYGDYVRETRRRFWVRPRSKDWWENFVLKEWDDEQWLSHFRMSRGTFFEIVEELRPHLDRRLTVMRRPIPVEKRLAITLWRLATPCVYRTTAEQFGVGCSTAAQIVLEVCFAMEVTLLSRTVKIGNVAEIMHGFGELGFPHCVGAVDGSHIPLQSPIHQASEYINRKDEYSMILQGTCDHKGRFINVEIGWSGKNHDAYVFANSGLCETMDAGVFVPTHPTIRLHGQQIPPLIIADGAYPLREWLMKPYGGALTPQQAHFNRCLRRARLVVEQAFGRLKGRWRSIGVRLELAEENIPSVISACVILHNICETKGHAMLVEAAEHNSVELATLGEPYVNEANRHTREGHKGFNVPASGLCARRSLLQLRRSSTQQRRAVGREAPLLRRPPQSNLPAAHPPHHLVMELLWL